MIRNMRHLRRTFFHKKSDMPTKMFILDVNTKLQSQKLTPGVNFFYTLSQLKNKKNDKNLMVFDDFQQTAEKTKNSFLEMIHLYEGRHAQRRGHVEFIYAAMKHMEEHGVERDLEVYKALINVMPKGKMIPTNIFQVEFMHYPKQQQCIIDLLEKMEDYGVMPDAEMEPLLLNIFGSRGFPLRKYWRMMYWMPKFKNLSPWRIPNPPPDDAFELAKLAIERITSVDLRTSIDVYQCEDVEDSLDKTWIVTGMSPVQENLLKNHPEDRPVIVEAGGRVWLRRFYVNYFVLKSEPPPENSRRLDEDIDDVSKIRVRYFGFGGGGDEKKEIIPAKSVHEQDDGIIYAVCATGTSSKDSALSWVRLLQRRKAPVLEKVPILFKFRQPSGDLIPFTDALSSEDKTFNETK